MKNVNTARISSQCKKNGCDFLSFNPVNNEVMVEIPHFTKYFFDNDEEEDRNSNQSILQTLKNNQITKSL